MSESTQTETRATEIAACDPRVGVRAQQAEIEAAIRRVLDSGRYILGPEVAAFEREFAAYIGGTHAVGVASGTDAIALSLRACGVGHGDLVFTVSHTSVATVAAVEMTGATPIFVDIDHATFTMDPDSLEDALQAADLRGHQFGRPRAVVPVHLYGLPADMSQIVAIARRHGLSVVEDCSQAHGAAIGKQRVGTFGDAAAFSLYPTKNLGALGDAGVVVTNRPDLFERLCLLREYGWKRRNISEIAGLNSRLDELQAAVLRVRLPELDNGNLRRRTIAATYDAALAESAVRMPACSAGTTHVFHQYVISIPDRDRLQQSLRAEGVQTLVHYPLAVHQQPAYAGRLAKVVPLETTERVVREILSLPMYPDLAVDVAAEVAGCVRSFFDGNVSSS